jgi:hypothetical protein
MKSNREKAGPVETLRMVAMRLPEVQEGIACEGTPVEKRAFKVRSKTFLFVDARVAMLKLRDSLADAASLAQRESARYQVGAHGWVTVTFDPESPLPLDRLETWIGESYRLMAPKGLLAAQSPAGGKTPQQATTKAAAKKAPNGLKKAVKRKAAKRSG